MPARQAKSRSCARCAGAGMPWASFVPEMRPPVLKAYLDRYAREVQRFFPIAKGSPEAAFTDLARHYPVFELQPLDDATPGAPGAAR
jgi:hypothetical protein